MAKRFMRNLLLAVGIFLVMAILVYTNVEFAEPVKEYVSFVVTTDFSVQPVLNKVGFSQKLADWNFKTILEAWPYVSFGR